ncbi:MAG: DUF4838 domain-containing protein [Clostridia bacterium]|nr:DUF4838 domain-containing protein [Clostridia bacterium]
MKIWKKSFALLLSAMLLTTALSACKNDEEETETPEEAIGELTKGRVERVTQLDGYIVEQAKSDYKIVVSDAAPEIVKLAANEFNYFFEKSTGFTLDVVSDSNLSFNDNAKYISLGDTTLSKAAEVSYDAGEYDGYTVQTVGKSIFVDGDNYGVLYGAYKTLYYLVDYEYFAPNIYDIRKNASEVKLMDFDVLQFPDFKIRTTGWGSVSSSVEVGNRLMMSTEPTDLTIGRPGHNSMDWLPVDTYLNPDDEENYHPEWYMDAPNPTQLCYTARGDETKLQLMLDTCLERLKTEMAENPVGRIAKMALSDDRLWCDCDACTESKNTYGTTSGAVVRFLNRLTEMAYEWMETEEGKPYARNLQIVFYAYYSLETAPAKYNAETDEYEPVDESVICNPYVIPMVSITNANYIQSVSTGSMNGAAREIISGWEVCSQEMHACLYNANFYHFMVPHNTFSAMQDWYQRYEQAGATSMYDLSQVNEYGMSSGWSNVKIYLDKELSWNANADVQELLDRFFNGVYQDGAEEMRKIFDEVRVITQYHAETNPKEFLTMNINGNNITKAKFWPLNKLNEWHELANSALEKIAYLETQDPEQYAMVYKYTRCERIWIDHLLYKIYQGSMSSAELSALKAEHYGDLVYCGVKREWQNVSIEDYLKGLQS